MPHLKTLLVLLALCIPFAAHGQALGTNASFGTLAGNPTDNAKLATALNATSPTGSQNAVQLNKNGALAGSFPVQEFKTTPNPQLAYWYAALHNCQNQVVRVEIDGTSRSIVDTTVTAANQTTNLSVTYPNRWVNQLTSALQTVCPSHGSGMRPFRWGTGTFSSQGMNADFYSAPSGVSATTYNTNYGPYQTGSNDPMVISFTSSTTAQITMLNTPAFDHMRMYAMNGSGLNPFTMYIDGTAVGTCGGNASSDAPVMCTSSAVSSGSHVASFACTTAPCAGYAAQVTNGTVGVDVDQVAVGGASAEVFGYNPATQLAFEQLNTDPIGLAVIEEGCNEPGNNVSTTQFQSTMNNLVSHYRGLAYPASVLIMAEAQDSISGQAPFYPIVTGTAAAQNTAFLDMRDRWPAPPSFFFGSDGIHESNIGNGEVYSSVITSILDVPSIQAAGVSVAALQGCTNNPGSIQCSSSTTASIIGAATTSSSSTAASFTWRSTGAHPMDLNLWNTANGNFLGGVFALYDETSQVFPFMYVPATGVVYFDVPLSSSANGTAAAGTGALFSLSPNGSSTGFGTGGSTPGTPTFTSSYGALAGTGWATTDRDVEILLSNTSSIAGSTSIGTLTFGKTFKNASGTAVNAACLVGGVANGALYPIYVSSVSTTAIGLSTLPNTTIPANQSDVLYTIHCGGYTQ